MKKLLLLVVIVALVVALSSPALAVDTTAPSRREPGTALLFSLLLTGGGQMYNGQTGKGLLMLGGVITSGLLYGSAVQNQGPSAGTPWLVAALGIATWSVVDAYTAAEAINREKGWALRIEPDNVGLGYAFKF